jgi:serine/threonine protein kinase
MGGAASSSARRSATAISPASFQSLARPRHLHDPKPAAYELPRNQTGTTASSFFSLTSSRCPQLSDYSIGAVIGSGGFGKIRELKRRRDGQWFALKCFEYSTMTIRDAETFVKELLALNRIPSHAFIIQLHAAFRDQSAVSYVMELLAGGDLRLLLHSGTKISEKMVAYVIGCVGLALHHVHSHGVIHRDVKPENVMFTTDGVPKLIDFGISFMVPVETRACVCQDKSGTPQYAAPEALVPRSHCHGYESDFWSLGVVMFEIVYGKRPFEIHAPSALVRYSKATYQSAWDLLLSIAQGHATVPLEMSEPPVSPAPLLATVTPLPSLDFASLYRLLHYNGAHAAEEGETALPPELMVSLPDLRATHAQPVNAAGAVATIASPRWSSSSPSTPAATAVAVSALPPPPPSSDCTSLLHCLLDVRLEKRYGVGRNFALFCRHPLFAAHDLDLHDPDAFALAPPPSPIQPDLEQVGMHVWTRFLAENLEVSALGTHSRSQSHTRLHPAPSFEANEIDEYLSRVQSETGVPLFYEPKQRSRLLPAAINRF